MSARWLRLLEVIWQTRDHLAHDAGYLATNGSSEERSRWRLAWQTVTPEGLLPVLAPSLARHPSPFIDRVFLARLSPTR